MSTARLTVRLPRALHRQIEREANRLGLSMNEFMQRAIAQEADKPTETMAFVEAVVRFQVPTRATTQQVERYLHQAVSQWRGQCDPSDPMSGLDHRSVEIVTLKS